MMSKGKKIYGIISLTVAVLMLAGCFLLNCQERVYAAEDDRINLERPSGDNADNGSAVEDNNNGFTFIYNNDEGGISTPVRMMLVLTVLAIAPSILVMLTSFTRIITVLHFVRTALGTQTSPPNQVMVGLALFLTLFIMSPVFSQINEEAIVPLDNGEITLETALENAQQPLREFMYNETQTKDINMFCDIAEVSYEDADDIPFTVLAPSFIVSELRTAFIIGFMIYVPFIVIDMVVSSVLMSMGMMMLPPTVISMPFKILLFVLADGWNLIIENLVRTFM